MSASVKGVVHALADDGREDVEECLADVAGEGEMRVEMAFKLVEEDAADASRDAAVRQPEIFLGPFRKARVEGRVMCGARRPHPRMEGLGVLLIGDRRIEIGAAAEPAPRGRQEAGVHMHRRHMRVGHVRDQADAGGEKARILLGAGIWLANSSENAPPTVETLTPTFSNTLPVIWPRTPPPPGVPLHRSGPREYNSNLASLPASRSIASNSSQIRSRSDSNQSRAACCWSSSSSMGRFTRPADHGSKSRDVGRARLRRPAGRLQPSASRCLTIAPQSLTCARRLAKLRRCAATSMRSSIAIGRGTPTLPSSHRLTAERLTRRSRGRGRSGCGSRGCASTLAIRRATSR